MSRTAEQAEIFDYVQHLSKLRSSYEPLRRGLLTELLVTKTTWVYERSSESGTALVAFNNAAQPATMQVEVKTEADLTAQLGRKLIQLPPKSAEVFLALH